MAEKGVIDRFLKTVTEGFRDPEAPVSARLEESDNASRYLNPFLYTLLTATLLTAVAHLVISWPDVDSNASG